MTRPDLQPPLIAIREIVARALAEDLVPLGDLTAGLLDADAVTSASFVAREAGVLAGTHCLREVFAQIDPSVSCVLELEDGAPLAVGSVLARVSGSLAPIVTAERVALNLLCHLSGVASLTRRYVQAVAAVNADTTLWDTRKTTPGLRALEKAAVRGGGGANHRGNLSEAVLIKDNHLGGIDIASAVHKAKRRWPGRMVEVECDTLEQVKQAIAAQASVVMCDNMTPEQVKEAVSLVHGASASHRCLIEASGGITLDNVAAFAAAGADLISVGAITHSAPILDIGLDLS